MELKQIIKRCCDPENRTLNQRKTIVLPGRHEQYPYHFRVHYAHECSVLLYELEKANISFMPIGKVPFDRAPADWTRSDNSCDRIKHRQNAQSWRQRRWYASWGIGIYTGETSGYEDAPWHDIEFTHQAILRAPDAVSACLEALISAVVTPLVTLTKDWGLRFSCRVEEYLHPDTPEATQYIYERCPMPTDLKHREVYVEVKGDMNYSVWDARYEILMGSLLKPPVISSDVLFGLLGFFRSAFHKPVFGSDVPSKEPSVQKSETEGFYKPLRIEDTRISIPEKTQAIREDNLSPLAIKRPRPVLTKQPYSEPKPFEIAKVLETDARVIGIETGLRHPDENRKIERALLEKELLFLDLPTDEYAESALRYYENEGIIARDWKPRSYLAYVLKHIPIDEQLKHPFKHGNTCIDSYRCNRLSDMGGNPDKIICPKCPVYEECQERGYLSQYKSIKDAAVMVCGTPHQLLMNPQYADPISDVFSGTDRVYVVNYTYASDLFVENRLSVGQLKSWTQYWGCSILGDFAHALLNAININKEDLTDNIATRVRSVVKAFGSAEEALVEQMFQVNAAIENSSSCIGMSVKDAVAFGVLDIHDAKNIDNIQKTSLYRSWTPWHSLKAFFDHYTRDADAPMCFEKGRLQYWIPPVLHRNVKKLVVLSPSLCEEYLKKTFPNEQIDIYNLGMKETLAGNRVYQLRSEMHSPHSILNYDLDWDALGLSSIGIRFAIGVHREVQRTPDTQHTLVLREGMNRVLEDTLKNRNTKPTVFFKKIAEQAKVLAAKFDGADVIWLLGTPYYPPHLIWKEAKILFGDAVEPLDYSASMNPYVFKDKRIQQLAEKYSLYALIGMLSYAGLQNSSKTIVLKTALRVPGFTDAPETMLFDWEDFEIAGRLDKLPETIARREAFEAEASQIDKTWLPYRVMEVLGVDRDEANRILREAHGRKGPVAVHHRPIGMANL